MDRVFKEKNFISETVDADLESGYFDQKVQTRFPPEPNGYLHIGHAKAIMISFGIANDYQGKCNLRFDDTNPANESPEFEKAIREDLTWLGYDWEDRLFYSSGHFEKLKEFAIQLIKKGLAYVCDLSTEELSRTRGTASFTKDGQHLTNPGENSPYRDRSVEENLSLFEDMAQGKCEEGSRTLRAKIDMAHPNLNMRDPIMYRVSKHVHWRTQQAHNIYPSYDWAHGQSDAIEGVTYSLCDNTFRNHRPLYDWFLDHLDILHPRQLEFGRMNIKGTITSKRKVTTLIDDGLVSGWDDPRLLTIRGLRRRGYTPGIIRKFCASTGVSSSESTIEPELLFHCAREELNKTAPRVMSVLNPIKVTIENYPENQTESFDAPINPEDPDAGSRQVEFSREIYIEREDFMEVPEKKFFRMAPGREVRLRYAYLATCTDIVKDEDGNVQEIICQYDPESKGGSSPDGRKVKATLHWISKHNAHKCQIRLYENIANLETEHHSPEDNLEVLYHSLVENHLLNEKPGYRCQFERMGYFCLDQDSTEGQQVWNRIVTLRDGKKKKP